MPQLRYVRTLEQVKQAAEKQAATLSSTIRSIRVEYETDPVIAKALTPKPLEALPGGVICVTFSHVAIHITPEFTFEIGSAIFGVKATYDGVDGIYLVTMPMTTEGAVVGGRETYGEPKKIAEIDFNHDDKQVSSVVRRMGLPYLQVEGTLGKQLDPREFTEYGYCYKAFPSCDRDKPFDNDPLLVRLEWQQKHEQAWQVDGELTLGESPLDPVADVPVRRLLRLEYEEGSTQSCGKVLRPVPADWILPFLHGRYDDPSGEGIEV